MISLHGHESAFTVFMEPHTRFSNYSYSLPFTRTRIVLHWVFEIFNRFNKWADAITQIKFHLPQKLGLRPKRSLKSISCFPNMTLLQEAYLNRSCLQPKKRQTHFKFGSRFMNQMQILISLTTGFPDCCPTHFSGPGLIFPCSYGFLGANPERRSRFE